MAFPIPPSPFRFGFQFVYYFRGAAVLFELDVVLLRRRCDARHVAVVLQVGALDPLADGVDYCMANEGKIGIQGLARSGW